MFLHFLIYPKKRTVRINSNYAAIFYPEQNLSPTHTYHAWRHRTAKLVQLKLVSKCSEMSLKSTKYFAF